MDLQLDLVREDGIQLETQNAKLRVVTPVGETGDAAGFTFRVDTPCTYISPSASTNAFSLRWYRSNTSVENRPCRSCGTLSSSLPTRVTSVRG